MSFLSRLAKKAFHLAVDHWRDLVSLGVSVLVFSAVAALMPVAAPALLTMAVAGFASGVAGAVVSDLLEGHSPRLKNVLLSATISTVLAVGSFGAAKFILPKIPNLWKPAQKMIQPAISSVTHPVVATVTNAVFEAATPLVNTALRTAEMSVGKIGHELANTIEEIRDAAKNAKPEATAPPPTVVSNPPAPAPLVARPRPPSRSKGIVGALGEVK